MPRQNHDILGRLKRAQSIAEITALLAEAETFEGVSEKTKRRYQRISKRRREELEDEEK